MDRSVNQIVDQLIREFGRTESEIDHALGRHGLTADEHAELHRRRRQVRAAWNAFQLASDK